MYFLNCGANKDMFKLNLKYPIIWLICLLRCITFELNWIGIERKWIGIELKDTESDLNWNWIKRNELIWALHVITRVFDGSIKKSGLFSSRTQGVPRWPTYTWLAQLLMRYVSPCAPILSLWSLTGASAFSLLRGCLSNFRGIGNSKHWCRAFKTLRILR